MIGSVDNVCTDIIVTIPVPQGTLLLGRYSAIIFDSRELIGGPSPICWTALLHLTCTLFLPMEFDFINGDVNLYLFALSMQNKLCRYFLRNCLPKTH